MMKRHDLANIKKMTTPELIREMDKLKDEYAKLVIDKSMGKITDVRMLKKKRRDIAQVLTVWRQKQLLVELKEAKDES